MTQVALVDTADQPENKHAEGVGIHQHRLRRCKTTVMPFRGRPRLGSGHIYQIIWRSPSSRVSKVRHFSGITTCVLVEDQHILRLYVTVNDT